MDNALFGSKAQIGLQEYKVGFSFFFQNNVAWHVVLLWNSIQIIISIDKLPY